MAPNSLRLGLLSNEVLAEQRVESASACLEVGSLNMQQRVSELFIQQRGSIYRYLMGVLGDAAEAEELTQEVFLRLYHCLQNGQRVEHWRAWLFRVAHNLALNQQKSSRWQAQENFRFWEQVAQFRKDPGPSPEQRLLLQEKYQQLHSAWTQLSAQQQQCLMLKAEGFRHKQIAEILGISPANVAQSLRRGLAKIMRETND